MISKNINKETIKGKAIPARVPFRKWKKNIPLKCIPFLSERRSRRFDKIWFSCHSKRPYKPHLFHEGISVNVIIEVDTIPPIIPIRKGYNNGNLLLCPLNYKIAKYLQHSVKYLSLYVWNLVSHNVICVYVFNNIILSLRSNLI